MGAERGDPEGPDEENLDVEDADEELDEGEVDPETVHAGEIDDVDEAVDEGEVGAVGALPVLGENWWGFVIRGGLSILLGVFAVSWPGLGPQLLAILFASYLFVDASFAFVTAVVGAEDRRRWWPMLAESAIGVVVSFGLYLAFGIDVADLALVVAAWAILTGALELYSATVLRRFLDARELWLTLAGVLSLGFGIVLLAYPDLSLSTFVWLLGGYAIFFGVAMIALAFQVRDVQRRSLAAATA